MAEAMLSIGEVATSTGFNVSAIRFYEQQGLLPEPERVSGQRRYTAAVVQRLGIIDAAKQAGFSLDEIGILLTSVDQGAPAHEQLRAVVGATRSRPALCSPTGLTRRGEPFNARGSVDGTTRGLAVAATGVKVLQKNFDWKG